MRKVAVVLVFLALAVAAGAWWVQLQLTTPYRGFAADEVFVTLPPGSAVSGIAARLDEAGVVSDPLVFRLAARLSGHDRRLQAGEYRFAEPATPYEVVDRLARGDVFTQPVTFPEGLTIEEMAVIAERAGFGTRTEFAEAAADVSLAANFDPEAASLEGYLFPDTYALARDADAAALVRRMVAGFEAAFDQDLRAMADAQGLSVREVTALASLIEKETARADELALVAAVYRNRLRIGMPMQADPTVIYAMRLAGRWDGNIRRDDLQIDSPYNTYRYPGLPPGPIASPGRAALVAALTPADVDYLYFVSRNDGSHVFAETLAEHNRNVARWQIRYFRERRE
jgi:UPF0755 protein